MSIHFNLQVQSQGQIGLELSRKDKQASARETRKVEKMVGVKDKITVLVLLTKIRPRARRDREDDENPRRHHSVKLSASTSRSPQTDHRRRDQDHADDESHSTSSRRHHSTQPNTSTSRSPHHARPSTGKSSKYTEEGRAPRDKQLAEWPPAGISHDAELTQGKAMQLIATGVPIFKGIMEPIAHASDEYFALYATCNGNGGAGSDRAEIFSRAFMADSMRLQGPGEAHRPWEALEQPSMAFTYGTLGGTITLNHWCSMNGNPHAPIELRDSGVQTLRHVDLQIILDRLIDLESGIDDESEEMLYRNLYKVLLKDLDKTFIARKGMEKQIADLIIALSRREYRAFFHQLLLSMELELRIQSKHHSEEAKERLLTQLPPWISWDLAVAKKWRECMMIEKYRTSDDLQQVKFRLLKKKSQVKALRKFSRAMKWPNLAMVDEALKELDPDDSPLEDRSADAMSFCTGLILPGPTQPWLLMNTLIDCDEDGGADLGGLTHMYPNSGFQYRGSTYWASTCIVGKVLAPTCQEIAGWVGPAIRSADIDRTQVLRIRQRMTPQVITKTDVLSMRVRSDPLGPPFPSDPVYPVGEFFLPWLDLVTPPVDNIRIEKLAFDVAKPNHHLDGGSPKRSSEMGKRPPTYDACILMMFHSSPRTHVLRVRMFLFFDYAFRIARMDQLLGIYNWAGVGSAGLNEDLQLGWAPDPEQLLGVKGSWKEGYDFTGAEWPFEQPAEGIDKDTVLVIEAWGVGDNECMARAWCSHWGLNAVVAVLGRTCVGCAMGGRFSWSNSSASSGKGSDNDGAIYQEFA
ncbi:hypothetical protein EYC84_011558 [Monilinia fructicola]|uniref:Uncharacterized protein n=1 Tax=Monilinia fructicola TaxID=38448 RepID=A0A5M9J5F8_MONFR|nr:hypothetical protein EYC84_011558 [Monilinia fructicola]